MLLLLADSASGVTSADPPEWAAEWLAKREARVAKQAEKADVRAARSVDEHMRKRSEPKT